MDSRSAWTHSRDRLVSALESLGFPAEFGDTVARFIGSPKGMERMVSYLNYEKPGRIEDIADEMLAIKSDIDWWREKKESENANAAYNEILNRRPDSED